MDTIKKTVARHRGQRRRRWRQAEAKRNGSLAERGISWNVLDDATKTMLGLPMMIGDDDVIGEGVQTLLNRGVDGVTVSLPADGHIPEAVDRCGRAPRPGARGGSGERPGVRRAAADALGLLHHHGRRRAGSGATDVAMAERVPDFMAYHVDEVLIQRKATGAALVSPHQVDHGAAAVVAGVDAVRRQGRAEAVGRPGVANTTWNTPPAVDPLQATVPLAVQPSGVARIWSTAAAKALA